MALSNDLISQFVKITKDKQDVKKETVVYGTIQKNDSGNDNYVNIDGSNISTPVAKTVIANEGDRVTVMIKNHTATVTGNLSNPSARAIDTLNISDLNASNAKIGQLEVANATITDRLDAHEVYINDLEADNVIIKDRLTVAEADIERLTAKEVDIETLNAAKAFVDTLQATNADVGYLVSTVAEIDELIFGSASGDVIQTSFSNAVIAQLGNAQIKSAMIDNISASKITSGDIITNNVRVKSRNGSLVISDETLQISDGTRVRVQVGKDAASDYSINIWDQNGNLMFSKGGITDAAIKEAIIRNDMVSDTANIHASKLDVDSLFEEINGSTNTIKSTKIYVDDKKQTLDVAFKSLTTDMTTQGQTISSQGTAISAIQGQISSKIWQQDIDTAKDALETQTEALSTRYSTLEQNLNGFKTVVSSTYATKESFDNLEIGGRNLLHNTKTFAYWSKAYSNMTAENGIVTWPSVSTLNWRSFHNRDIPIKYNDVRDKKITISLEVRSDEYELINSEANRGLMISLQLHRAGDTSRYKYYDKTYYTLPLTNGWQRVIYTFTASDSFFTGKVSDKDQTIDPETDNFIVSFYDYSLYSMQIRNLQLEYGNMATSYSPAPEDMVTTDELLSVNNRMIIAESQIIQNTESINQRVTKTELSSSINNITIGGKNWLLNTSEHKTVTGKNTKNQCINLYNFTDDVEELASQTITCSFKYTISNYESGMFRINTSPVYWQRISEIITPTGDGTFYSTMTLPLASDTGYNLIQVRMDNFVGSIEFSEMKIEKGNKATDWTPAPEDIETQISATETLIEQTAADLTVLINSSAKTATNYLNFSSSGLVIGDLTADTLGKNVLIDSDSVDIRNGNTTLASFGSDHLYLAKNSRDAKIDLCNGLAEMYHEIDTKGYSVFNIDTTYGLSYIKMSAPMHDLLVLENTNSTNGVIIKGMINGTTVGGFGLLRDGNMVRYGSDADDDNPVKNIVLDTGNFLAEMDDGWHYTGGYGDDFTQYNNEEYAKVRYRKIGGMVEIRGVMRPTKIITGSSTQHELFSLPEGYRPDSYMYQRCQADGVRSWLLTISPSGVVSFSRYGNGTSYIDAETTAWLPFQVTYFVN